MPALPFKLNQARRHHIPEQTRKVTNWRDYDESLRRRGSLTVWFSDEAVEAWEAERRTSRGGQPEYSDLAILTALTFKAVFRLAYRQTEGLIGSVIGLLGLGLAVPDHSTLFRRVEELEVARAKPRRAGARGRTPPPAVRMSAPSPCTCWWTARHCVARVGVAGAPAPTPSGVRRCGRTPGVLSRCAWSGQRMRAVIPSFDRI